MKPGVVEEAAGRSCMSTWYGANDKARNDFKPKVLKGEQKKKRARSEEKETERQSAIRTWEDQKQTLGSGSWTRLGKVLVVLAFSKDNQLVEDRACKDDKLAEASLRGERPPGCSSKARGCEPQQMEMCVMSTRARLRSRILTPKLVVFFSRGIQVRTE